MNVLVVEDEPRMLDILERHIARMGYEVRGASNAGEALEQLEGRTADVVLTDIRMPGLDGRALLEIVRERHPDTRVILMTAFGRVEDAVEAMRAGAYWYICKPFKMDEVAGILRNAAREVLLVKQVEGLRHAVHGRWSADRLMGRSKAMQEVRALIRQAAGLSATVLVTGRSGTGKELAARAIHYEGPRAIRPFVAVNCAAIPEALFESAMFGHRRGAFTGAVSNQVGFFEQADGSTLFLDEVGEIPFTQQPKILRVLQDGEVTAVGATRTTKVDLRIICATNRDLEQLVAQGTFREDLYYRINVLRISIPSLCEHAEDIPAIAEHVLLDIARDHGSPAPGFTPQALEALSVRSWPGNVRELRNVLERALIAARGRRIDVGDLSHAKPHTPSLARPEHTVGASLADIERDHIARVLETTGWNRSSAAQVLGIDRRTLFAKIRRYGLVGPLRQGPDPKRTI
jgi:DNA-binding NtrC family response regulator